MMYTFENEWKCVFWRNTTWNWWSCIWELTYIGNVWRNTTLILLIIHLWFEMHWESFTLVCTSWLRNALLTSMHFILHLYSFKFCWKVKSLLYIYVKDLLCITICKQHWHTLQDSLSVFHSPLFQYHDLLRFGARCPEKMSIERLHFAMKILCIEIWVVTHCGHDFHIEYLYFVSFVLEREFVLLYIIVSLVDDLSFSFFLFPACSHVSVGLYSGL
jgi:hypothetical protein